MTFTKASSEPNMSSGCLKSKTTAKARTSSSYRVKFLLGKELNMGVTMGDELLQSTNKRRRFQRRGSKSSSMMMAALTVKFDCYSNSIDQPCFAGMEEDRRKKGLPCMKEINVVKEINASFASLNTYDYTRTDQQSITIDHFDA
jgi:hypothetical protein